MTEKTYPYYFKDLIYQTVVTQGIDSGYRLKDEVLKVEDVEEFLNNYRLKISQKTRDAAAWPNALEVLGIQSQQLKEEVEKEVVRTKRPYSSPYYRHTSLKDCR